MSPSTERYSSRIAVSIAGANTDEVLAQLGEASRHVALAEVRLDAMALDPDRPEGSSSLDLPRLIRASPVELIITCRPRRERGAFEGNESARIALLGHALELGARYVDVEHDVTERFAGAVGRVIVSRHFFDETPPALQAVVERLAEGGAIAKLATAAREPDDALRILELLVGAGPPVVVMAMGSLGEVTRVAGPLFDRCLFTYAALSAAQRTAAGQPTVGELFDEAGLGAEPITRVDIELDARSTAAPLAYRREGSALRLRLGEAAGYGPSFARRLAEILPCAAVSNQSSTP